MNFRKYVYVSPQQQVTIPDGGWSCHRHTAYHYEYVVDGKLFRSASFEWRQGKDIFKKIELAAWRDDKSVRKLSSVEWWKMDLRLIGK